jgi:hypothetical protein
MVEVSTRKIPGKKNYFTNDAIKKTYFLLPRFKCIGNKRTSVTHIYI